MLVNLTGCVHFLLASADGARDNFRGPSYEHDGDRYETSDLMTGNAAMLFMTGFSDTRTASIDRATSVPLLASNEYLPVPAMPRQNSFSNHVSFAFGPQLIGKGGKFSDRFGTTTSRRTYLEALGYAMYNYDLPNNKGRLFGGLGPYLGLGLWGKIKYDDRGSTETIAAFDRNAGGYSRFDAGLAFMAGYQLPQGVLLIISRQQGLTNIDPGRGDDKTRTRVWSLNVGYPLKKLTDKLQKK